MMIQHRNIGHDWQFNQQQQQLQRYYDANRFLVRLMQIQGSVSPNVRADIEDSQPAAALGRTATALSRDLWELIIFHRLHNGIGDRLNNLAAGAIALPHGFGKVEKTHRRSTNGSES